MGCLFCVNRGVDRFGCGRLCLGSIEYLSRRVRRMAYEGERQRPKVDFDLIFCPSKIYLTHCEALKKIKMDKFASGMSLNGSFIFHLEIILGNIPNLFLIYN